MKLIWTKSTMPLSLLIRWGLKEPVSHFAIVFDESIVFQSNLLGVGIDWYPGFLKKETVVYQLNYQLPLGQEEAVYQSVLQKYYGQPYGWAAFMYFMWRAALNRFFNVPFPLVNKWDKPNTDLCVQLAAAAASVEPKIATIKDLGMISPYKLYKVITNE